MPPPSPIAILSIISPLFPITVGFKERRMVFWWYVCTAFASDIAIYISKHITHTPFIPFADLFLLAEFAMLTAAYRSIVFRKNISAPIIALPLMLLFLWRTSGLQKIDILCMGLFCLFYIIYSLAGFYRIIQKPEERSLATSYFFWINVGILMYASGALLMFVFREYMQKLDKHLYDLLWQSVFSGLNITKNVCIGIAFIQLRRQAGHPA